MRAMAEPGRIEQLAAPSGIPAALPTSLAVVAKTLADFETPLWLAPALRDAPDVVDYLRFAAGAPIVPDPGQAAFALVPDAVDLPPFSWFAQGTDAYPDRSTTIVMEVKRLSLNKGFELSGPGIAGTRSLAAGPLPDNFVERMAENCALFPRGVDLVLTCADAVACLPRSVRLAAG